MDQINKRREALQERTGRAPAWGTMRIFNRDWMIASGYAWQDPLCCGAGWGATCLRSPGRAGSECLSWR